MRRGCTNGGAPAYAWEKFRTWVLHNDIPSAHWPSGLGCNGMLRLVLTVLVEDGHLLQRGADLDPLARLCAECLRLDTRQRLQRLNQRFRLAASISATMLRTSSRS